MKKQRIHLIAIGGAVMHNLALELNRIGHSISGSDDEIYDPARSRLAEKGLLPSSTGWDADKITPDLDAVILGMHAKQDNPELLKAQELGIRVFSFPEFIYAHSKEKKRIVIAGSHGKTTITSMIMYVLKAAGKDFDYMVGAQIEGFEYMVQLSENAPVIIMEGDEYLTSPIDRRPKFMLYDPHLCLISGIAWDHINVFPTEENYIEQFEALVQSMPEGRQIVYNEEDAEVNRILEAFSNSTGSDLIPYSTPPHDLKQNRYEIELNGQRKPVLIFGKHNLSNLAGAWKVCLQLGIKTEEFLQHISTFKGAAQRLETIYEDEKNIVLKDFAHSPSKVKATTEAVQERFPDWNIIACFELHTFSSLNKAFLDHYKDTLSAVKQKIVYVDQHTLKQKNYPPISKEELVAAFNDSELEYATTVGELEAHIDKLVSEKNVFLMMSSGNFGGLELGEFGKK